MDNYEDIINMPYVKSKTHKHMSNHDRAAQFAPFAALTGYEKIIEETARLTDQRIILSIDKKEEIERKLKFYIECGTGHILKITYFVQDKKKEGGKYLTIETDTVKVDAYHKCLIVKGIRISFVDIFDLESDIFDN